MVTTSHAVHGKKRIAQKNTPDMGERKVCLGGNYLPDLTFSHNHPFLNKRGAYPQRLRRQAAGNGFQKMKASWLEFH